MWRFRGTPHYLKKHADRLKLTANGIKQAEANREMHKLSTLLSQLCERWHKSRKEDGRAVFGYGELKEVTAALDHGETEASKLFALAASAHEMLDEAWAAYGIARPPRRFAILSDYDDDDDGVAASRAPSTNGVAHDAIFEPTPIAAKG